MSFALMPFGKFELSKFILFAFLNWIITCEEIEKPAPGYSFLQELNERHMARIKIKFFII